MDMGMARHLMILQVTALVLSMYCCLVVSQQQSSSSAPAVPALLPPPPPRTRRTLCIPGERDALLAFKAGLTDPGNYLSSWQAGQDCCRWSGVQCSNRTGHVVKLQIRRIGGEVRSSLLALRHLQTLQFSRNNFGGRPIPEFIGAITSLRHLELGSSNFGGRIPPHLGNLSNLLQLTIWNKTRGSQPLYATDLAWVSGLGKLQSLAMSRVNLSTAIDWAHAINMLPSLLQLELSACGLQNIVPPPSHVNLTSLESLQLSFNSFGSSLGASSLFLNLPSLQTFSIPDSGIQGPIPDAIGNLTSLQYLTIANNSITGPLPSTIRNLNNTQTLVLSYNFISMDISQLFSRLPKSGLRALYLNFNNLTGSLPAQLDEFSSLKNLWLSNNHISGEIPIGIRQLVNLEQLWLSSNNLQGVVTEDHFTNMSSLQHLWISGNSLTLMVENTWNTPFRLISAGFRSCELGPQFPAWLSSQPISTIDISNTSISDSIPDEFWIATSSTAHELGMSGNQIVGRLPTFFSSLGLVTLDINSNQLVGPIPKLPDNLFYLDLSKNNLSGTLPSEVGPAPTLGLLILFKTSISGTIPCSLLQSPNLRFLDLSENLLNGTLPNCLQGSETVGVYVY